MSLYKHIWLLLLNDGQVRWLRIEQEIIVKIRAFYLVKVSVCETILLFAKTVKHDSP